MSMNYSSSSSSSSFPATVFTPKMCLSLGIVTINPKTNFPISDNTFFFFDHSLLNPCFKQNYKGNRYFYFDFDSLFASYMMLWEL